MNHAWIKKINYVDTNREAFSNTYKILIEMQK